MADRSPPPRSGQLLHDVEKLLRLSGLPTSSRESLGGFSLYQRGSQVELSWHVSSDFDEHLVIAQGEQSDRPLTLVELRMLDAMQRAMAEILRNEGFTVMLAPPPVEEDPTPRLYVVDGPEHLDEHLRKTR
jgi:hypothetical protein